MRRLSVRVCVLTALPLAVFVICLVLLAGESFALDTFEPDTLPGSEAPLPLDEEGVCRSIDWEGDVDWFVLDAQAGASYDIRLEPVTSGLWADCRVEVFDGQGTRIAEDDDSGTKLMPRVLVEAKCDGRWTIAVSGYDVFTTGPYRIFAAQVVPVSIAGRLSSTDGTPVADTLIRVWRYTDGLWAPAADCATDDNGEYRSGPLIAGRYKVGAVSEADGGRSAFHPDAQTLATGGEIELAWGQTRADVDITWHEVEPDAEPRRPERLAGQDRYATAVAVSRDAFPGGAEHVVLASGTMWADGLSAAALAGVLDAPVLLVPREVVPPIVAEEIARLGAREAWIVGGSGVVGESARRQIEAARGIACVRRIGGDDRYGTAAAVAAQVIDLHDAIGQPWDGTLIVVTAGNFPDALATSPMAAAKGWPVLLTRPDALHPATADFIARAKTERVVLAGGLSAISAEVETQTRALRPGATVTRVAGADRYRTAVALAEYGQKHAGLTTNGVALSSGVSFPDALSSSVRQARAGAVLLLTPPNALDPSVEEYLARRGDIGPRHVVVIGGEAAVSERARQGALAALAH